MIFKTMMTMMKGQSKSNTKKIVHLVNSQLQITKRKIILMVR